MTWRDEAACRSDLLEDRTVYFNHLFFPEEEGRGAIARAFCNVCPVTEDCLAEGAELREWEGVRGGLSGPERFRLRRRFARAAAAAHSR